MMNSKRKLSHSWLVPLEPQTDDSSTTTTTTVSDEQAPTFIPSPENCGYREGYYHGCGSLGTGYYSEETREAYILLLEDLRAWRARCQQRCIELSKCCHTGGWCLLLRSSTKRRKLEQDLEEAIDYLSYTEDMTSFFECRLNTDGPRSPIPHQNLTAAGCKRRFSFREGCIAALALRLAY